MRRKTGAVDERSQHVADQFELPMLVAAMLMIRNPWFDVPTTIAPLPPSLFAVNARFAPNGDNANPAEDIVRFR